MREIIERKVPKLGVALLASLAVAQGAEAASAKADGPDIYIQCANTAANLNEGGVNYGSTLATKREVKLSFSAEALSDLDSNCANETQTDRTISVEVLDNGHVIARNNHLVTPANDQGETVFEDIHTNRPMEKGDHIAVEFQAQVSVQGETVGDALVGKPIVFAYPRPIGNLPNAK